VNSVAHMRNEYIFPPKGVNTSLVSSEPASYLLPIQEHVIGIAGLEASCCRCQFLEEGDNILRGVEQVTGVGALPSDGAGEVVLALQIEDRGPFAPVVVAARAAVT
jgi:hypothetical protein